MPSGAVTEIVPVATAHVGFVITTVGVAGIERTEIFVGVAFA